MIPTESIATIIYEITRFGAVTTDEAADRGEYTRHSADAMLNRAARAIPLTKVERGVWVINDDVSDLAEKVRPVLERARQEVEALPANSQFARPLLHGDLVILVRALEALLRERAKTA